MTHILMKVKFAHKIDVPGYLEPLRINVTITLPELFVSALVFTADFPIRFSLQIKTYKFMNSYYSSWKRTEMGTIELEIAKSPSPYVWKNLYSDVDYIPANQYIWREMYYKYRKQMDAGFALLEDAEMQREEKEDKLLE